MTKLFSLILISLVSSFSFAQETAQTLPPGPMFGGVAGFRQTTVEVDSPDTADSNVGVQAGMLFYNPIGSMWEARVGALYGQRNFSVKSGTTDISAKLGYLDVPLTVGFAPSPAISMFGGFLFALNVEKSCTSNAGACSLSGVNGFDTALTFGGSMKIAETVGIEVFYEKNTGKLADGVVSASSAGINLVYLTE